MMIDLIPASVDCIRDAPKGQYLAGIAHSSSANKAVVYYHPEGSTYKRYREIIDRCKCAAELPPSSSSTDKWPLGYRLIAKRRKPGEIGVGDTFERLTGKGGKRFVAAMSRLGVNCGCVNRKAKWNRMYPYTSPEILERTPNKVSTS